MFKYWKHYLLCETRTSTAAILFDFDLSTSQNAWEFPRIFSLSLSRNFSEIFSDTLDGHICDRTLIAIFQKKNWEKIFPTKDSKSMRTNSKARRHWGRYRLRGHSFIFFFLQICSKTANQYLQGSDIKILDVCEICKNNFKSRYF